MATRLEFSSFPLDPDLFQLKGFVIILPSHTGTSDKTIILGKQHRTVLLPIPIYRATKTVKKEQAKTIKTILQKGLEIVCR